MHSKPAKGSLQYSVLAAFHSEGGGKGGGSRGIYSSLCRPLQTCCWMHFGTDCSNYSLKKDQENWVLNNSLRTLENGLCFFIGRIGKRWCFQKKRWMRRGGGGSLIHRLKRMLQSTLGKAAKAAKAERQTGRRKCWKKKNRTVAWSHAGSTPAQLTESLKQKPRVI